MIGFSIMMCFVSLILLFIGRALLKGNHSFLHGKVYDSIQDKEGYAKSTGKPIILLALGIAFAGILAVAIPIQCSILASIVVILVVVVLAIAWQHNISKHFL